MKGKFTLIILLLFTLTNALFADEVIHSYNNKYINAHKIITAKINHSDETPVDVMYQQIVPMYEENQDPARTPIIEVYFGELYHNSRTDNTLKWIKTQLLDDKEARDDFKAEVNLISFEGNSLKKSYEANHFLNKIKISDLKINYEEIPSDISFEEPNLYSNYSIEKSKKRKPAGVVNQRVFWTLMRMTSATGATTASLYYTQDMSLGASLAIGIWPGIASGAITYYSGSYGSWLSSGKWSKWLTESDKPFAKNLRKSFKIDHANLSKLGKNQFAKVVKRLATSEEYLKWYLTEIAFTTTAIKIPQALGGIGEFTGIITEATDVMMGATMGMLAQGPGDIAIQIRKYQKVAELKDKIIKGTLKVENEKALLKEIDLILSKTTSITDGSHVALRKIENWARSRATMLSFFSVMGVGMEIAGVPLSRPILLSIGVGGAFYYSKVQGAFTQKTKLGRSLERFLKPFRDKTRKVHTVISRTCHRIFERRGTSF